MTSPSVRLLTLREEEAYEAFLHSREGGLLYYSSRYRRFLEDLLGCQSRYWITGAGDQITGVLPTMERSGPLGRVLNCLPFFGSHGGVLAANPSTQSTLLGHYQELVSEADLAAATMIENPLEPFPKDLHPLRTHRDHRIGQFVDLLPWQGRDLESCLGLVESSARRNVRKALREGIQVSRESAALPELEDFHRQSMGAIGGTPKDSRFFQLLPLHFRPDLDYRIYLARLDGEPLAALLLFTYHQTVEYFVPASRVDLRSLQPLPLLVATAMRETATEGYRYWNWGGTWPTQDGVYRFKKKWGTRDLPYEYYVQIRNQNLLKASQTTLLEGYPGFYVLPFSALRSPAS